MNTQLCPSCQTPIPAGAPGGFCPACLLRGADEPPPPGRAAPSLKEIAGAFPQLEVESLLGQGGMGFVYKVRQPALDRTVALKILSPELSRDPAFEERFAREARVLGKLNHPNIVAVFEHGRSGGFFYLLMEYVDGVNLRQAMRAGRFTPQQALAVVPGICDALQAAHAQGIWHRDIKPENILLDARGGVKIVDFGIARIVGDPARDFTLTATGGALGSAAYMAPEQHENPHDVDHRADIYSLGVVLYEMLTGELPLGRFPAPSQRAAVSARIDEIVFQTLAKEREMRQQSADEVKTDVAGVATAPATTPDAGRERVFRRVKIPALGLMAAAMLNLLYYGNVALNASLAGGWKPTQDGNMLNYFMPNAGFALAISQGSPLTPGIVIFLMAGSSILSLAGALKMRRLTSYRLCIIAATLGIFTPPGLLIGAVSGIWALIVLTSKEVRGAYSIPEAPPLSNTPHPFTPLGLSVIGLVGGLTLFGAAAGFSYGSTQSALLSLSLVPIVLGVFGLWAYRKSIPKDPASRRFRWNILTALVLAGICALALVSAWARNQQLSAKRLWEQQITARAVIQAQNDKIAAGQHAAETTGKTPQADASNSAAPAKLDAVTSEAAEAPPGVNEENRSFSVSGEVARQGEYPLPEGRPTTVSMAVTLAGGIGTFGNPKRVLLVRIGKDGRTTTTRVDVTRAYLGKAGREGDPVLLPGDRIHVQQ